jgi:hypothetical protein
MKHPRILGALLLGALSLLDAADQQPPLTFNPAKAHENLQTFRGVPLSNIPGNGQTNDVNYGSDGRAPATPGTLNQFQSLLSFGGSLTNKTTNGSGSSVLIAGRARLGNPFVGSSFAYLFGDIIPPPTTDEYGVSLDQTNPTTSRPPTIPSTYWAAEPYTTSNHVGAAYYWSPHAETVYATQPGFVSVKWRRAQPGVPVGSPPNVTTVILNSDSRTYTVYTKEEVISPSPVKAPRRRYWTEGPFAAVGRPINIPPERLKDIKVV